MNTPRDASDAKLDELLRRWADSLPADWPDDERMIRTILAGNPGRQPRMPQARTSWSVLATCAAVLLMTMLAMPCSRNSTVRPGTVNSTSQSAARLIELWNGTAELFGPELNSMCDLDGELVLNLVQNAALPAAHEHALIVLIVRTRSTEAVPWTTVWNGRVVCPLGETVDFTSDSTRSGGSIWVQTRSDGRLVSSHWLNWADYPEISGAVDAAVRPGDQCVVSERTSDGHSIQIVQQVWISRAG